MEIPEDVKKKYGTNGELVYKKGHKDGKLEGQKVAKSAFANEVNSTVNAILKGKEKENYKAPTAESVGKLANSLFKFGAKEPDRNSMKRLAILALKSMEAMAVPSKQTKVKAEPPTPSTN